MNNSKRYMKRKNNKGGFRNEPETKNADSSNATGSDDSH